MARTTRGNAVQRFEKYIDSLVTTPNVNSGLNHCTKDNRISLDNFLLQHSLATLFIVSFLAATILPLGSEWLLVSLILLRAYQLEDVIIVATLGNFLGACTTYGIGFWGSSFLATNILRIDEVRFHKTTLLYQKYGSWSLLLSWVPIIGDPLCLVSGSLRLNFLLFSLITFSGKLIRYIAIATITVSTMI
ncbi:MAG: DedA family protein [Desulfoarculaceae bacterium]|nr:DedA family protein [Desulfoarculaceae bacterium]